MVDDHARRRRRGQDRPDLLAQHGRAVRVEHRRRLVEQEQARAQRQNTGERQPLTLPAAEVGGGVVARVGKADAAQRGVHPRPDLGRRHRMVLQAERDVVAAAGQDRLGQRVLQQQPRPRRARGDRLTSGQWGRHPVDEKIALLLAAPPAAVGVSRGEQAREPGQQRGLAGPAGSEQQQPLARADVEVHPAHGPGPPSGVPPPPAEGAHARGARHTRCAARPLASGASAPVRARARVRPHDPAPAMTTPEAVATAM